MADQRREIPMRHLFDGSDLNVYDHEIANLSAGAPGPDLLSECCELFRIATDHRMKFELENNSYLFQYGPTIGTTEFRDTLAGFLSRGYADSVNKSDLVQTSGATHGLHLILSTLMDLRGVIFVDEVTYMIALESISQFNTLRIVPVPLEDDGPNLHELNRLIEQHQFNAEGKLFWGLYYTIPTYHNPTGILFSEAKCRELIRLARVHDILIGCDDVYNLLHYGQDGTSSEPPPKRLFAYDIEHLGQPGWQGNVISNGSFSKILSPGIRLGWMECPPRCMEALRNSGILKSGGAASNYVAGIVTTLIQLGLAERQLQRYAEKYSDRLRAAAETLDAKLPTQCTYTKPTGGYFVWIRFPEGVDCNDFNRFCTERYRVAAIAGSRFSAAGTSRNYIRLTFAFHPVDFLRRNVAKLCDAIAEYLAQDFGTATGTRGQ